MLVKKVESHLSYGGKLPHYGVSSAGKHGWPSSVWLSHFFSQYTLRNEGTINLIPCYMSVSLHVTLKKSLAYQWATALRK